MTDIALSSLSVWDWLVIFVSVLSVGLGIWNGLVRTVFALLAWVVAVVATPFLAHRAIATFALPTQTWIVFLAVFVLLVLFVRLAGVLLARLIGKMGLGLADRSLGGLLGLARAALLLMIASSLAHALDLNATAAWQSSYSRPLLDALVNWARPFMPQRVELTRQI